MKSATYLLVGVLCLALAGPAQAADPPAAAPAKPVGKDVGMYLKDFSLKAPLDGGKVFTNKSFHGKSTIYAFIQSACSNCRNEVRELNALYPEIKGKYNVVAIFIDLDDTRMAKYREKNEIEYPILHDPGADVAESVGYSSTPAMIIVAADGKILKKMSGYSEKMIVEAVKELK